MLYLLETPGTGTRVLGGLSYRESHFGLELLHQSHLISSMDLVEVNPLIETVIIILLNKAV